MQSFFSYITLYKIIPRAAEKPIEIMGDNFLLYYLQSYLLFLFSFEYRLIPRAKPRADDHQKEGNKVCPAR